MTKSAFVSVVGRPSSGKSTLINTLCGEKVSIVSPVPQTTRNKIRGIVNREEGQLVFIDTPGFHQSDRKANQYMTGVIDESLEESEIILYLLDSTRTPGTEEEIIAEKLSRRRDKLVAGINKTDLPQSIPGEAEAFLARTVGFSSDSPAYRISALTGEGTEELLSALFALAPEGELMYPGDYYTDQEPEFRISEIIREKAISRVRQEVPHSLYVEIADMETRSDEKTNLWIRAFLVVERETQKGFLIGQGGNTIKEIRRESMKEIHRLFPYRVHLDLRVKVNKKWRKNDQVLRRLMR